MGELLAGRIGGVLSADIAVERALRFYSRVLRTGAHPLWREDGLNNLGLPIMGLGEASADNSEDRPHKRKAACKVAAHDGRRRPRPTRQPQDNACRETGSASGAAMHGCPLDDQTFFLSTRLLRNTA